MKPSMPKTGYKRTIGRIFEKLGVGENKRSKEEDRKIRRLVYEAVAKEVLAFLYDHLDPLKRLAFKEDIKSTRGDLNKLNNCISAYYQIIPNHRVRLEQRLKAFEAAFYAKLLKESQTSKREKEKEKYLGRLKRRSKTLKLKS